MSGDDPSVDPPARPIAAFICHAKEDHAFALRIRQELRRHGLSCWIAPEDVRLGEPYPDEITAALAGSRCVVAVLSAAADRSGHVRREIELALFGEKIPVLPVMLGAGRLSAGMLYMIRLLHWIEVPPLDEDDAIRRIVAAIESPGAWPEMAQTPGARRWTRRLSAWSGIAVAAVLTAALVLAGLAVRGWLDDRADDAARAQSYLTYGYVSGLRIVADPLEPSGRALQLSVAVARLAASRPGRLLLALDGPERQTPVELSSEIDWTQHNRPQVLRVTMADARAIQVCLQRALDDGMAVVLQRFRIEAAAPGQMPVVAEAGQPQVRHGDGHRCGSR